MSQAAEDFAALCRKARRHLCRRDPILKDLIATVGPCTLAPGGDPFALLVRAIIAQLISTQAARTIGARVEEAVGGKVTAEAMLALGEVGLRPLGLSKAKAQAILDLASRVQDGRAPLDRIDGMSDAEVQACLLEVRGIGVWTVQMFLIFGMGRADVLPVRDFGLRAAVQERYQLEELPGPEQLHELATRWQPYRSIATWYLWRSRGLVPQS